MIILFCYAVILTIATVTGYLFAALIWHWAVGVYAFVIECPECGGWGRYDGQECETCRGDGALEIDDGDDAEDRGHDEWIDRQAGVL